MGETYQVAMTLDAYNVIMQMTTVKHPLLFRLRPALRKINVKPLSRLALSYPRSRRQYACYRATRLRSSRY